jgi:hypothetical protein
MLCHGHGGKVSHRRGADLYCSKECAEQHRAAQSIFEQVLRDTGFSQMKDVPNLWERDGVHLSIDEVLREGLDSTLARHREAVDARL